MVTQTAMVGAHDGGGGSGGVSDGMGGGQGRWHVPAGSVHERGGMCESHGV